MQLIKKVNALIDEFHLLKHQFYQAWSRGELNQTILQSYAAQYYHQVKSFPRFISRVHTNCDEINVRKILVENLADEEIHGTDHPTLWMNFAEGLGLTKNEVLKTEQSPETAAMVETFYQLASTDWQAGLCALYAYECQVPDVSASKIAGLKDFYNIDDEKTLQFFSAHQTYDVVHAEKVAELIEQFVEPAQALTATKMACQSMWKFLDGMCREHHISC